MDYIVVARLRVSADNAEQANQKALDFFSEGSAAVTLLAIEPPRAEPDVADMARRTLMAGFTS